jgi:hypothetical protein
VTRRRLELIRWACAGVCLAIVVARLWYPSLPLWTGGFGVLLFFAFVVVGFPAAMLTLHLHPPKWFRYLERPKR